MIENLPYTGATEREVLGYMKSRFPWFGQRDLENTEDYPVGTDEMYLRQYLRGVGGPFVDFLVYVDVGVGWKLTPKNFPTEDQGAEAKERCETVMKKMGLYTTMTQFATYREVVGRAALVKTYNVDGGFYSNEYEKVTGVDCIDPTTLDINQVEKVMADRTGTVQFLQRPPGKMYENVDPVNLNQDRVVYKTRNPLSSYSTYGISIFQNCLTDTTTANKFPRYRRDIARKYSGVMRHVKIDEEALMQTPMGIEILSDEKASDEYMDKIIGVVEEQERKGTNLVTYKFIDSDVETYGGKEPDLPGIERQTLESIGLKTGLPIQMVMYGDNVNRATLDTMSDLFINRREKGPRAQIYAPIIEDVARDILLSEGYTQGYMNVEFNPFLSKDLNSVAQRVVALVNAGVMGLVEGRREVNLPDKIEDNEAEQVARTLFKDLFQRAPSSAPIIGKPGQELNQPTPITEVALNQALLLNGNKIRPLYLEAEV